MSVPRIKIVRVYENENKAPLHGLDRLKATRYFDSNLTSERLIEQSCYLEQHGSWLEFIGLDEKKNYPSKMIDRSNTIWELVAVERKYLSFLLMLRDVYQRPFPCERQSDVDLKACLFPSLEQLIEAHDRILRFSLALHNEDEKHIVNHLGPYYAELFSPDQVNSLSEMYGNFSFTQTHLRDKIEESQNDPILAKFYETCKDNPRSGRRTLEDCYLVITQRWAKVLTLIEVIIKNTLIPPSELTTLNTTLKAIQSILSQSQSILVAKENAEQVKELSRLFTTSHGSRMTPGESKVAAEMKRAKLLHWGTLTMFPMNPSSFPGQSKGTPLTGVALDTCFFLLKRTYNNEYRLFTDTKIPSVICWGENFGYFRRVSGKNMFILLVEEQMDQFAYKTGDDLRHWEQAFNEGFSKPIPEVIVDKKQLEERWNQTVLVLELLEQLDAKTKWAWHARTRVNLRLIKLWLNRLGEPDEDEDEENEKEQIGTQNSLHRVESGKENRQQPDNQIDERDEQHHENEGSDVDDNESKSSEENCDGSSLSSGFIKNKTMLQVPNNYDNMDKIIERFQDSFVLLMRTLGADQDTIASLKAVQSFSVSNPNLNAKSRKNANKNSKEHHLLPNYTPKQRSESSNLFRRWSDRSRSRSDLPHEVQSMLLDSDLGSTSVVRVSHDVSDDEDYVQEYGDEAGPDSVMESDDYSVVSGTEKVFLLKQLRTLVKSSYDFFPLIYDMRRESLRPLSGLGMDGGRGGVESSTKRNINLGVEKLRKDYSMFQAEKEEWTKRRTVEFERIGREQEKLAKAHQQLAQAEEALEEKTRLYKEKCADLQAKIDMWASVAHRNDSSSSSMMPKIIAPDTIPIRGSSSLETRDDTSITDPTDSIFQRRSFRPTTPTIDRKESLDKAGSGNCSPSPSITSLDHLGGSRLNQARLAWLKGVKAKDLQLMKHSPKTESATPSRISTNPLLRNLADQPSDKKGSSSSGKHHHGFRKFRH